MPSERCRITNPTIALFQEDGHLVSGMVPTGTVIRFDSDAFNDGIMNATCDGRKVSMFGQHLRSWSEPVRD